MRFGIFIFLICNTAIAGSDDAFKAVCKVASTVKNKPEYHNSGTAFFVNSSNGRYQILTAAHVVENYDTFNIKLFYNGIPSEPISAKFIRSNHDPDDIALLEVDKAAVDKYGEPKIIPIAEPGLHPNYEKIFTAGFPCICHNKQEKSIIWCTGF